MDAVNKIVNLKHPTHVFGSDIIVEVVKITPKIAGDWLKANKHNRPVRRRHVAFLADEIERGNWQLNGQPIVISDDEMVLDGQHRLMAIIESGQTIECLVVYGINPEAFKTMDTGAVRTSADAIALNYGHAATGTARAVATAVRWCIRMENHFYGSMNRISNTEAIEYVKQHNSLWRFAEILSDLPCAARPLPLGCGIALYEMTSRKSEAEADSFMHDVFSGENLQLDTAPYLLRIMLARSAAGTRSYSMDTRMKMAVKAWNVYRRKIKANRQLIAIHPADPDRLELL